MKILKEGQRVRAPFPDTYEIKRGVIEDALSVLYFVRFDDGTTAFYSNRDLDVVAIKGDEDEK